MSSVEVFEVVVPSHIWTRIDHTQLEIWHGTGIARRITVRSDGSVSLLGGVGWEVRGTRPTRYPS